ncbi:MAG: PilZ domain-containing protein [Magnetococcales bacterium]|nr:PilZ domain-containing protein [Magnetococcales bacterium]
MIHDRRTATRTPWHNRVTLHFANGSIHNVPVLDLSLSGLRLQLHALASYPINPHSLQQVNFTSDDDSTPSLPELPCRFVWASPDELALQFLFSNPESQQRLSQFVDLLDDTLP